MSRMSWSFFLLPFFLFTGIAGQAVGLYCLAIVIPAIFGRHLVAYGADNGQSGARPLALLGVALLSLWLLFPLANLINWASPPPLLPSSSDSAGFALNLPFAKLLASKLSSTWLVSSVFILLLAWQARRAVGKPQASLATLQREGAWADEGLAAFCRGSLWACLGFGVYFIFQHVTGFDYRMPDHSLPSNRLLGDTGLYRLTGLYGHPLSMAAVALAQTGFFALLFCVSFTSQHNARASQNIWLFSRNARLTLMACACMNFVFLVISGGRSAALIGILAMFALVGFFLGRRYSRKSVAVVVLSLAVVFGCVIKGTGLLDRFEDLQASWQNGSGPGMERFVFWRVHWKIFSDYPLFGRGGAHLSHGIRDLYYEQAGLATFHEKYNAHNVYLEVLSNIGLLGAVAAGLLLVWVGRRLWQLSGPSKSSRALCLAVFFGVALNAVNGLTQNTFFDASLTAIYLAWFWLLIWQSHLLRAAGACQATVIKT